MKTYLFDFDGTLVDSMPAYANVMIRILKEYKVDYPADIIKIITPLGFKGTAEYFLKLGLNESIENLGKLMGDYAYKEYAFNIPAKSNVYETLKKLKEQGHSLNVLTASPHVTLDVCLKRLGLYDTFDNVWSCDDFSTTKADLEIYIRAAEKLNTPVQKILFLDDNFNADKTAKTAGMKVCGVFDETSREYIEEMKNICDYYINDFSELLEIDF